MKIRIFRKIYLEINNPEVNFTLGLHNEIIKVVFASEEELNKPKEYFSEDRVETFNKLTFGFLIFNITILYQMASGNKFCPEGMKTSLGRCYITDCPACSSPRENNQIYYNDEWNMEETYEQWYSKIKFMHDSIVLPDKRTLSKSLYITKDGFDTKKFEQKLIDIYNEEHADRLRIKK